MKKKGIVALLAAGAMMCLSACGAGFTTEDAQAYVQSALDASYKADFDEYVKLTDSSKEEAEEMYQQNIDNVLTGIGLEDIGVSDELIGQYRELAPDLLALANYEVTGAEEDGDGFAVEVTYQAYTGWNELDAELETVLTDIASSMTEMPSDEEINEIVYEEMLKLVQQKLEDPSYGEAQTFTVHVDKGSDNVYSINENDLIDLDYAMYAGE